jgi:hypothetical protein
MEATWLHVVPLIIPRKHRDFNGLENIITLQLRYIRTPSSHPSWVERKERSQSDTNEHHAPAAHFCRVRALTCACFTRTMEPAIALGNTLVEMSLTYV